MRDDYRWLFCEADLAGIMLLVLDMKEIRSKDLVRASSNYGRAKKGAQRLVDSGLLKMYATDVPHPATTYMLTEKGRQVASLLKSIRSLLEEEYRLGTLDDSYERN